MADHDLDSLTQKSRVKVEATMKNSKCRDQIMRGMRADNKGGILKTMKPSH